MQVASESWGGGKEVTASRESLQEEFSLPALLFYPSKIHFGHIASRMIREYISVVLSHSSLSQFVTAAESKSHGYMEENFVLACSGEV